MGYMLKILAQPQATSSETATASLNQYEEHIRAYEECGERYRLEEVVKLSRLKMIMPVKVQEFVALKAPSECSYVEMRKVISEYLLNFTKGAAPMLDILGVQQEQKPVKPKKQDWWPEEWPEPSGELGYWGQESWDDDWYGEWAGDIDALKGKGKKGKGKGKGKGKRCFECDEEGHFARD